MDLITVLIGAVIFFYSLSTIYFRLKKPENFGKLELLKEKYGEKRGNLIHIFSYTIMPMLFGILIIISGVNGVSVTKLITG